MTSPTFPDAAGAFTLPLTEAAAVLEMTPTELADLVRGGCAYALLVPPSEVTDRPPLCFSPGLLRDLRQRLESRADESEAAEVRTVANALRSYLAAHRPTEDYDEALRRQVPVLLRNRSGRVLAHVQLEWIINEVERTKPMAGPGSFSHLPRHTTEVLVRLGCLNVKGSRPLGGGPQRWHSWWRIPRSIWSVDGAFDGDVSDWPVFAAPVLGVTEEGW